MRQARDDIHNSAAAVCRRRANHLLLMSGLWVSAPAPAPSPPLAPTRHWLVAALAPTCSSADVGAEGPFFVDLAIASVVARVSSRKAECSHTLYSHHTTPPPDPRPLCECSQSATSTTSTVDRNPGARNADLNSIEGPGCTFFSASPYRAISISPNTSHPASKPRSCRLAPPEHTRVQ